MALREHSLIGKTVSSDLGSNPKCSQSQKPEFDSQPDSSQVVRVVQWHYTGGEQVTLMKEPTYERNIVLEIQVRLLAGTGC